MINNHSCKTLKGALLIAGIVLIAGCQSNPPEDTPSEGTLPVYAWTTPDTPFACLPLTGHCLSPMPSNLFTIRDPTTATGIRVNLTEENYSEGIFAYAAQFIAPALLNMADGFSPVGQIVISLRAPVDSASLPLTLEDSVNPESPILILDTPGCEPVPFHVQTDPRGAFHNPPQNFLVLIPAKPLNMACTYLVLLKKDLKAYGGAPFPPYPVFESLKTDLPLKDQDVSRLRDLYRGLFNFIEERIGLSREEILLAFDFTTRSEESLFAPMLRIRDQIWEQSRLNPPQLSINSILPPLLEPNEACEVLGSYPSPSFRTDEEKILSLDGEGMPYCAGLEEITFLLKLPKIPMGLRAPVVIFGHGLWVCKETVFQISEDLLKAGFAIVAIDAACHGSRIPTDGFIADLFRLETVQRATACLAQTIADELELVELLKGDLGRLDILPYHPQGTSGDGIPDLDTERLYYLGQSMGTVIGLTFAAMCPEIHAAALNVPGSGIVNIVTQGEITGPLVGWRFIPQGTSLLDASLLFVSGQMLVDYLDPVHFSSLLYNVPFPGSRDRRPVLLQEAIHDGLIPNWDTDILARSLDIPVLEPYSYLAYGLSSSACPAKGSGIFQYNFTNNPYLSHLLMLLVPESRLQVIKFLVSCEEGTPGIVNPYAQ